MPQIVPTPEETHKSPWPQRLLLSSGIISITLLVAGLVLKEHIKSQALGFIIKRSFKEYGIDGMSYDKITFSNNQYTIHNLSPIIAPGVAYFSHKGFSFSKISGRFSWADIFRKIIHINCISGASIQLKIKKGLFIDAREIEFLWNKNCVLDNCRIEDVEIMMKTPLGKIDAYVDGVFNQSAGKVNMHCAGNKVEADLNISWNPDEVEYSIDNATIKHKTQMMTFGKSHFICKKDNIDGMGQLDNLDTTYGSLQKPILWKLKGKATESVLNLNINSDHFNFEGSWQRHNINGKATLSIQNDDLAQWWLVNYKDWSFDISGKIHANFDLNFEGGWSKFNGNGEVKLQDAKIQHNQFALNGINTVFKLSALNPIQSYASQTLQAASLRFEALQMRDIKAEYSIDGDIQFNNVQAQTLGGDVEIYGIEQGKFTANLRNLELEKCLDIAGLKSIQGGGKLDGSLKLLVENNLRVLSGKLYSSSAQGWLKYTGSETPLEALRDLHFTLLEINLEPATNAKELKADLRIIGFNPQVMNGYPFEFNINTTGSMGQLAKQALHKMETMH